MFDCGSDVTAYHNEEVTLPTAERDDMRARRNSNRDRLKAGLKRNEKPSPWDLASQGSYAMRTMVQHPKKDYDIDDGSYFNRSDLQDAKSNDMEPAAARSMVCEALADDKFSRAPEVRDNCVRVFYNEGYHLDVPVYRRITSTDGNGKETERLELASGDTWKEADARAVTVWFDETNRTLSPDTHNGRQFRRVVRLAKKFTRSRESWGTKAGSGLLVTKLCAERFVASTDRDDIALRRTLESIRDRLDGSLLINHPVVVGDTITKGTADAKATFLRDRLKKYLPELETLDASDCDRPKALRAWADFFNAAWFRERANEAEKTNSNKAGPIGEGGPAIVFGTRSSSEPAVDKRGGGRYA